MDGCVIQEHVKYHNPGESFHLGLLISVSVTLIVFNGKVNEFKMFPLDTQEVRMPTNEYVNKCSDAKVVVLS